MKTCTPLGSLSQVRFLFEDSAAKIRSARREDEGQEFYNHPWRVNFHILKLLPVWAVARI